MTASIREPALASAAESDVVLETPTGTLAGTLTAPTTSKPRTAVLIVAGSGPTDRDGNNPGLPHKNDAYKLLAAALAANGCASLRYDKRGIGGSRAAMSSESELRFTTYADDAAAWVRRLRSDRRFDRVVIAGHSEGSLVGMLAAAATGPDAFVSLEGAGQPASAILLEQLKGKLPPDQYASSERIVASLRAGSAEPLPASAPAYMQSLFRDSVQPYLISWFAQDPCAVLSRLRLPTTIVQGTADVQVTTADAHLLAEAKPDSRLIVVEAMNHMLRYAPDTSTPERIMAGYTDASLPIDAAVTRAIVTAAP